MIFANVRHHSPIFQFCAWDHVWTRKLTWTLILNEEYTSSGVTNYVARNIRSGIDDIARHSPLCRISTAANYIRRARNVPVNALRGTWTSWREQLKKQKREIALYGRPNRSKSSTESIQRVAATIAGTTNEKIAITTHQNIYTSSIKFARKEKYHSVSKRFGQFARDEFPSRRRDLCSSKIRTSGTWETLLYREHNVAELRRVVKAVAS